MSVKLHNSTLENNPWVSLNKILGSVSGVKNLPGRSGVPKALWPRNKSDAASFIQPMAWSLPDWVVPVASSFCSTVYTHFDNMRGDTQNFREFARNNMNTNFHRHLRSRNLGLVYNDPSDFTIFGSTHWSLPALACLVQGDSLARGPKLLSIKIMLCLSVN